MHRRRRAAGERAVALLAVVIVLVGTAASVFGALAWRSYVRASSARAFASTASAASAALDNALQRDVELTSTVRTIIQTTPNLTNSRLRQWFKTLDLGTNFPGSFGFTYVEAVPPKKLTAFARRASTDPPFGIALGHRFSLQPVVAGAPYCLTRFGVAGLPNGMSVEGAGLSSVLSFTAPDVNYCALAIGTLLERAARSGMTEAVPLAQLLAEPVNVKGASLSMPGFLAHVGLVATIVPVFSIGTSSASGGARAVSGWILGLYEADEILAPLVGASRHDTVTLSYRDPLGGTVVLDRAGHGAGEMMSRTVHLDVDGSWIATFAAPATTSGLSATEQFLAVLLAGLVLTALLFVLIRVLAGSRAQALRLAEARTGELRHQALHDNLTALPNRALIFDRTEQTLVRARHDEHLVSVLFIDLDGFKDVNDTYGHVIGDELLRAVAMRFRAAVPAVSTVGRLGGDEFVVLVETTDRDKGEFIAERLLCELRAPFVLGTDQAVQLSVTASIGIASGAETSAEELLREADIALYEAKANGKDRFTVFETAMHDALQNRLVLEFDLRNALSRDEFFVQYQPIFELGSMAVTSVEALLRWRHPTRGVIGPSEFVPLLESSGRIVEVGRYVLHEACTEVARWNAAGHNLQASVNVSPRQLDSPGFVDHVRDALEVSGLTASSLVLEITETTLMSDTERAIVELEALKALGVEIAVDDFGTGYSSLAYLERFPVDSIKIDQSFVAGMDATRESRTLVHTLVQLGKALGLRTLAEGIEEPSQLTRLKAEECDVGQGFLFARPLDPKDLAALLDEARAATSTHVS